MIEVLISLFLSTSGDYKISLLILSSNLVLVSILLSMTAGSYGGNLTATGHPVLFPRRSLHLKNEQHQHYPVFVNLIPSLFLLILITS